MSHLFNPIDHHYDPTLVTNKPENSSSRVDKIFRRTTVKVGTKLVGPFEVASSATLTLPGPQI